jgi:aspartyl-tRNA(Asn)/glutamyl-tRNA(Gln) amidotransferase subunit A
VACAAGAFVELGATVEQVDVIMDDPINVFVPHWYVGAANLLRGFTAEQRAKMDEGLQEIAAAGAQIALMDYLTAMRRRAELGAAMRRFHGTYDLLLTPTLPLAAFEAGKERPDPAHQPRWINWAPFSNPFNLTQQPAASVPCGLTAAGLPVGLQIVGPMHADALVLRAARAFEAARPWPLPEAPRRAAG